MHFELQINTLQPIKTLKFLRRNMANRKSNLSKFRIAKTPVEKVSCCSWADNKCFLSKYYTTKILQKSFKYGLFKILKRAAKFKSFTSY